MAEGGHDVSIRLKAARPFPSLKYYVLPSVRVVRSVLRVEHRFRRVVTGGAANLGARQRTTTFQQDRSNLGRTRLPRPKV